MFFVQKLVPGVYHPETGLRFQSPDKFFSPAGADDPVMDAIQQSYFCMVPQGGLPDLLQGGTEKAETGPAFV